MLIKEYELREFKKKFNAKMRKSTVENSDKYKALKQELVRHLKQFDKNLHAFNGLEFFIEGNTLFMTYVETTQQVMKLTFLWRVNKLDKKDIEAIVKDFCMNDLKMKEDELPIVKIEKSYMRQNLAIYWKDNKTISTSIYTINQIEVEEVIRIIKHECIHHYLVHKNKDASDTSEDFIKLIIEHDAYVSKEEKAFEQYENYLSSIEEDDTEEF